MESFENQLAIKSERIKLNPETIEPMAPEKGGSLVIMQRHADYDRGTGHITDDGKLETINNSSVLIGKILENIPPEERQDVEILVVASPTIKNEGQRSVETAGAVIESVKDVFQKYNIPIKNILTETPRPTESIEQPRMLTDQSGFKEFLVEKYGDGSKEFWKAYEEDLHQEERRQMGAEGPIEMSNRFAYFTSVLARYARAFHSRNAEKPKRLIIWNVSHYDTVTTFFKNHVANIPQTEYVPVGYNGGISMVIDPENNASITVKGKKYSVDLASKKNPKL